MRVRILHKFHDKADFMKVYLVGETVTFDDARAEALIARGLVEKDEEKKEENPSEMSEADNASVEAVKKLLFPEEKAVKPVATRRKSSQKES